MRYWGRQGWSCGPAPTGGYRLPLKQDGEFDWALIGAHEFEINGEKVVSHRGHIYKRREFEQEEKGKKLPAAVKYSRGSKPTDDPAIIEKGSGDINYVTLITFKGGGYAINDFKPVGRVERPAAQSTTPPPDAAPEPEPTPEPVPAAAKAADVPTQVTHVAKPEGFVFPADDAKGAISAILRLNGFVPNAMSATDHDDMRVLVAAVADGVQPINIVKDRVPKSWGGFGVDDLGKYWAHPNYIDAWWEHRPFKPLTKDEAFQKQKALIETAKKAATGEVKPPPVEEAKPEAAAPAPDRLSRLTGNLVKTFARDANKDEAGLTEMVWEISDRRTKVLKELTQQEGDDLIEMLQIIIKSNNRPAA
jgi:hypothetical protein